MFAERRGRAARRRFADVCGETRAGGAAALRGRFACGLFFGVATKRPPGGGCLLYAKHAKLMRDFSNTSYDACHAGHADPAAPSG
eukprot:6801247-Prymnesium_polylepis.1